MGIFSYDNKFFQTLNLILDVVALSLIWTISSLPIITIGASTTALYHTVDKVFRREEGGLVEGILACVFPGFQAGHRLVADFPGGLHRSGG